jgi:DNA invertase Pin-like site-specific DNA recombinase
VARLVQTTLLEARQMVKLAIGYVRVSTGGQATEGVSLDAQQAKIQAWCLANDVELGNNKGKQ